MLLMTEKGVRGGICNAVHRYAKVNKEYMSDCGENKESSYLNYWDVNNLQAWTVSQKLPTFGFEWVKDTSKFTENFIKNYDKKMKQVIFLKLH